MKDDVEIPEVIPRKRRQLEAALDKWIAVWLARDDLTPSERRRLEEEKDRRRTANPDPMVLGLLVPQEGTTPAQLEYLQGFVRDAGPQRVLSPWPLRLGLTPGTFVRDPDMKEIVKTASHVVATPKTVAPTPGESGVWGMVRYAKHRRLPVLVVLPSGEQLQQEGDDG